jgi:uncharacterized protein YraI
METSMRGALKLLVALMLLVMSEGAFAQRALALRTVNVRAGPDKAFPVVTWLHRSTDVYVVGCTEGWRWCDIVAGRARGWFDGTYLSGAFRSARTPFVKFDVDSYWDAHYRSRDWYPEKSSWRNWGAPSFRPHPNSASYPIRPPLTICSTQS